MSKINLNTKLRIEKSENCSGELNNEKLIPILKEKHYYVKNRTLDGDAPKQFIKAYFYEEDSGFRKSNPQSWMSFICKTAEKWYPHESVTEYMINRVGQELGLNMNDIRLVNANSQIRFMSKFFLNDNEKLIHGAEICGEHLGDYDLAKQIANNKPIARELFTFEFINDAIKAVFPNSHDVIMIDLVKMITYDALVGNNDRHFYNWGVIDTKKKTRKTLYLSPIYDTARGLLWNWDDANVENTYKIHKDRSGGAKIKNYIQKAAPRISIESNSNVNHFDLIKFIRNHSVEYNDIINSLSSKDNENKILEMLNKEFYPLFIKERCHFITLILKSRFEQVRIT